MILNNDFRRFNTYIFNYWYFTFLNFKNVNLKYNGSGKFLKLNNITSFYVYKFFYNINKTLFVYNNNLIVKNSNSNLVTQKLFDELFNFKNYFNIIFIFNDRWVENCSLLIVNKSLLLYLYFISNFINLYNKYYNRSFVNISFKFIDSEKFRNNEGNLYLKRFLRYKYYYKRRRFKYRKYSTKFKLSYI